MLHPPVWPLLSFLKDEHWHSILMWHLQRKQWWINTWMSSSLNI
jgi:hypothetical protein